ncbi:hypothetical protein CC53_gp157 [Rhizobium phage vB_RleS_L338C]|uniref:hypothetical protein n=1 Tax=Rhizobium phage vB_RleS_L338C TaxID=1414737 RepID=UPI0003D7DA31|nr:hypothetical protein CC53_gp157 [Rhizobium phage vB_RleS_L338C]AHC30574.1 hypothetical protein L338C_157 [Rhizobium phage vB_RleS_L338C]QNH72167.1 hypothetical protein P11VFA_163 [Rhizobium phage P11VFA]
MTEETKNRWEGIVKIQLPLAGSVSDALIYDKTKHVHVFLPVGDVEEIAKGRVKFFTKARIDSDGFLHIEEDAEEQTW